jgi:hypothetical protein
LARQFKNQPLTSWGRKPQNEKSILAVANNHIARRKKGIARPGAIEIDIVVRRIGIEKTNLFQIAVWSIVDSQDPQTT